MKQERGGKWSWKKSGVGAEGENDIAWKGRRKRTELGRGREGGQGGKGRGIVS